MLTVIILIDIWSHFVAEAIHVEQGGPSSGLFQNIWQQSANTMNEMMEKFAPCKMKFNGLNTQMNFGNHFGQFRSRIGSKSFDPPDSCPCPSIDNKGCPTCNCLTEGQQAHYGTNVVSRQLSPTSPMEPSKTKLDSKYDTTPSSTITSTERATNSRIAGNMTTKVPVHVSPYKKVDERGHDGFHKENLEITVGNISKRNSTSGSVRKNGTVPSENTTLYIGAISALSVLLTFVTIMSFVFLYKWRKTVEGLKHQQNELYFTEKSFRINMERQNETFNRDSQSRNKQELPIVQKTSVLTQAGNDSILTLDDSTAIKTPLSSPGPQSAAPLLPDRTNAFQYQTDAFHNIYLELM